VKFTLITTLKLVVADLLELPLHAPGQSLDSYINIIPSSPTWFGKQGWGSPVTGWLGWGAEPCILVPRRISGNLIE